MYILTRHLSIPSMLTWRSESQNGRQSHPSHSLRPPRVPSLCTHFRRIPPPLPTSTLTSPVLDPNCFRTIIPLNIQFKLKPVAMAELGHMDLQDIRSKPWKCPRCDSLDTKFCYYNNYNYSQPRHFCKTCRRYWTIGGVLRNVPVGGRCRQSKNSSKPKPKAAMIVRDSPSSKSNSWKSDLEILPTPLKLNQAGDWYGWTENGRESEAGIVAAAGDPPAEKRARGEGFGSLDHLPTSDETE